MKIDSIRSYNHNSTNFGATYPVQHWIAESIHGSYAMADSKIAKKLQGKIVRILNKALEDTTKEMNPREQNFRTYMEACDNDYKNICEYERILQRKKIQSPKLDSAKTKKQRITKVRSFYNREETGIADFTPYTYIISGKDIQSLEDNLAKAIGKEKSKAKEFLSHPYSPETIEAIKMYNKKGLDFVNSLEIRIKNNRTGMTYVLHTKFEIIRNKLGKIKDYRFLDARFLPEYGPESPFVKLGYRK